MVLIAVVIPRGIRREHVLAALDRIDREGVPVSRSQRTVDLLHGEKSYPPKLVISLAAGIATGRELSSNDFITTEAERVLLGLGFSIARRGGALRKIRPSDVDAKSSNPPANSPEFLSAEDLERLEERLLRSGPLFRWSEIRNSPDLPPASSGVYAWFFTSVPSGVPTNGCFVRDGATLLYVGISPRNLKSKSTLRERLWTHYEGVAEFSTLRTTLGCLLEQELGTVLRRVGSGKTQTFAEKEVALSQWMATNTLITWVELAQPWVLEHHLLSRLILPLNIAGNSSHPFHGQLGEVRRLAGERAAKLEVVPRANTIFLVSCVGEKHDRPMPAKDLYRSEWFEKSRNFVERQRAPWFILSAKYGLVAPGDVIPSYDETLKDKTIEERRRWADEVVQKLRPYLKPGTRLIFLAGKRYRESLVPALQALGCSIEIPMEGLRIGEQLSWLSRH